ncbi:hypothetical protein Syun_003364 [Stephania yunnanensis]|uniref:MADS-box domain-containing protein n=1 Tax=Stephania yunnanensis TaxID=152371 RepID=A0AAP0L0Z5_9MAGN
MHMCMIDETMKISLVVFSPAGKPFSFHHPSEEHTAIDHFLNGHNPSDFNNTARQSMDTKEGFWLQEIELQRTSKVVSTSSSLCLINRGSNEGHMVEDEEINALLGFYDPVTPPHL